MKHTKQNVGMSHRITAFFLTVCMAANLFLPIVSAQAEESTSKPISLCGFAELPQKIKEQSIPLGVSLDKLNLPSTLEAVANSVLENTEPLPAEPDKPTADVPPPDNSTPSESVPEAPPPNESTPEAPPPSESTLEVPTPSESAPEVATPSESAPEVPTPSESAPEAPTPSESAPEVPTPSESAPDVPNTETDNSAAEVPTPEVPKSDSSKTEPITIHSVTWESAPLYDENVAGEYRFTAVLPEQYALVEGVAMPEILITVYDDKAASKIITSWQWNDPNGYISEGILPMPGVSKENPINLDALISMLPASILPTLNASQPSNTPIPPEGSENNTPAPISLAWSSKDFVHGEDGSFPVQGDYKFTAAMQEGYALSADAPPLEITVRLGGAMLLPTNGTFTTLEIREGTATGDVVVNLLDAASIATGWALKPGADYYLCADLTAPAGAEHIKIHYGGADAANGVTFANPPGGSYVPKTFETHDYLDELLSYKNLPDPTYGSKNLDYSLQDGEMIYHIKKKEGTSNTVFAIGLVVKDAMYDGSKNIKNAVSVAVGSYANNTFTTASASDSTQTFDLKIAEKGKFNSFLSPQTLNAAIGEKGANGSMQYLANISPDQPEILYDEASFDLTYPVGAELEIGLDTAFSKTHTSLGSMTVGNAAPSADKKIQTVHVTVQKGLKTSANHGSCFVRLNFPENAGFKAGDKYLLTTANVQLTMGGTKKSVDIKSGGNQISYTLTSSGEDETWMIGYDRIAYNHTIDASSQSYLVPLGNAAFGNKSTTLATPYGKTFEAEYNTTNTAANVSYITIPIGSNTSPTIEWSGIAADGTSKTGTISEPGTYQNAGQTFYFLPAKDFGIVSFTSAKADIGTLTDKYTSAATSTSWLFARDNLAGAYGYFTTDEPGIQVVNNYRLYNTEPALRDKANGDLSATATGTSSDYCGIGWSGVPKLNGDTLTTTSSIDAGGVATLSGPLFPYTAPSNGKGNNGTRGTATLVIDPIIYLTLPQGMSVVEKDLSFELEKKDFQVNADTATKTKLLHQIENVSYLNTTGDGVSIYKITFPKGTRLGYFDETGNQSQLYYTIPLLTSKSLETRRYGLSELLCITAQNQPEATKYGGANQGTINYALADKYGINGGKPLGTFANEQGSADGTNVTTPIGFGVQQSSEINLYSAVSVTKIGGKVIPQEEQHWYAHSSDPNSIALLGQNSEGRLRLQVSNTSATQGDALRIILPIPQKGEDLGDSFMDAPSGFTMSMTYDKTASNEKFAATYIKTTGTYDTIADRDNIVSYEECPQADANAVLFTANTVPKGEYMIYLDFTVAGGAPKSVDIWRPVYAYTVSGNRNVSNGSYVASEVAASSISGVAFADMNRNGRQDVGEDGAADITVVAQDAQNRIVSTKTAQDGSYQFLAIRESIIDMSFALSAEGQKTQRFNVPPLSDTASAIASTVTPAADGLTASKTFTADAGEEKVHAAVDGFVSLGYNGGSGATGNLPKTTTHVKGTSVTVAVKPDNLAVKGYRFTGWNTAQNGTGTAYQPGASIRMSESVTLYAQWALASYTVTFNYRGATSGNDESSRVLAHNEAYGKGKTLPTPAKNGYTFGGWYTDTTKPKTKVEDKTPFNLGADTVLYALWTPQTMKVTYNVNGGNGTIAEKSVNWEAGVLPTVDEAKVITKNGFTLSGWTYKDSAVTGLDTYGKLAVTDSTTNITLTAQWQAKGGYTVKYETNGGSTIANKTGIKWTDAHLLPPTNPTKAKNAFVGWKMGTIDVLDSSSYGSLAINDTNLEIILNAQWTEIKGNVVSYDTAGGSPVNDMVNVANDATNLLPTTNPAKAGYTLDKWVVSGTQTVVTSATKYSDISNNANAIILNAIWKAKSYMINYTLGNEGSIPATTKSWSEKGLLPTQPTRTGYTFDGWYYGGTKVTASTSVSTLIPQDDADTITLTAKWNERTYTVNYSSGGGTSFPQKNNVKYTATGLLPDVSPVKLGYSFDGWKCGEKPVTASTICSDLLTNDTDGGITLVAQWTAKTGFTVQYDTDGGAPSPSSKTVAWIDSSLLPTDAITKSGYTLSGWLSGRTPVTNVTAFSALTQSDQSGTTVTLVAQWKAKSSYTVKYDTDGGTAVTDKTGVKWTDTGLLPTTSPTKTGYDFVKWQHNTTDVSAQSTYGALAATDTTTEITLKAVWAEKSSYTVKYDTDGGSAVADKANVKWTDAALLPSDNPTKNDHAFVEWQCNTIKVTATDSYGSLAKQDTVQSITLKAVWILVADNTVRYDTGGGTVISDKTGVTASDKNLLPKENPQRAGYQFTGWKFGNTTVTNETIYSSLTLEKVLTLTAQWTEKSGYTVKYDTDGGSAVAEKTGVKWTDSNLLPTTSPTKTGYTFDSWYYGNTKVEAATTVAALIPLDDTGIILLTAHWSAEPGKTPDISGTVEDDKGSPVENASVKLTQGSNIKYGPVTTDAQGKYFIADLKSGIYNLVAEKNGQIVTVIITVEKSDLQQTLVLPANKKNSVLEVAGDDTPPVVVGNLEEIAKDTQLEQSKTSLTIKLTVKKEAEKTIEKSPHAEIRKEAGANADILFLDAVLTKQVDNGELDDIGDTNTKVLELVIPFDFTEKDNVRVYRYHGDVNPFTKLVAKPAAGMAQDETCYLDKSAGRIHVYAEKFSAYAIAYDKKSGGGGTGGGGSTDGSGSGGSGSGGSSSHDNSEYEFWMHVKEEINSANSGDVIKVNAKSNDKMPVSVMDTLRKNPDVTIVITWSGGKTITIPAGKAAKQEKGRIYYPLSLLAKLYDGIMEESVLKPKSAQNPGTGGPSKLVPVNGDGKLITLEAPSPTIENAESAQTTITPPHVGFEADAFVDTPEEKAAQSMNPIAIAVAILLAAVGGAVALLWKRSKKEQE